MNEVKVYLGPLRSELTLCVNALCSMQELVYRTKFATHRLYWHRSVLYSNGTPVTNEGRRLFRSLRKGEPVTIEWRAV